MTDKELAVAVEKIIAAVRDLLTFVQGLSDDEWTKFRDTEDRRRQARPTVADPVCARTPQQVG